MKLTWVPNALCFIRGAIGPPVVAYLSIHHLDAAAFYTLLGFAATDYFDGVAAKVLNAQSRLGKEWIDPLADFALSLGALSGWVWSVQHWGVRAGIAATLIVIAVTLKALKHAGPTVRVKNFAAFVSPLNYVACAVVFLYIYALKGLADGELLILNFGLAPLVIIAIWFKFYRLKEWWEGRF